MAVKHALKHLDAASALALAVGAGIGWVAWYPPVWFPILWLLPLAWGIRSTRVRVALIIGYYAMALGPIGPAMTEFSGNAAAGAGVWVAATILLTAPYLALSRWRYTGASWGIAVLLTALPPLGVIGLASPLFAATGFRGAGVFGLIAAAVLQAGIASAFYRIRWSAAVATVVLAGLCWATVVAPRATLPVIAVDTNYGRTPTQLSSWVTRQVKLMRRATDMIRQDGERKVILFPEDIVGTWTVTSAWAWGPVAARAKRHHDTVLLGATLQAHHGRLDGLVEMGRDPGVIAARQPIPVGEWNPFAPNSYIAHPWRFGPERVGGLPMSVLICYEQMLIWPSAWSFLGGSTEPVAILAPSNHGWSGHDLTEVRIQHGAAKALGALYGVPVYQADNDAGVKG